MFWETIPGQIATYAAAVVGIGVIARAVWKSLRVGRRVTKAIVNLAEIGDVDSWPNGSADLPSSISAIYGQQTETNRLIASQNDKLDKTAGRLDSYIVAHRADHGLSD